jgi:CRP-like cAMP-binding protein
VYASGHDDGKVYLLLSGLIKDILPTPEGREYLIDIFAPGEIFGELSLCGEVKRLRSAVAMQDSTVKQIGSRTLLNLLASESPLGELAHYLGHRVAAQEGVITGFLTANSEQRLAMTLLRLARTLGGKDLHGIRVPHTISQSDFARMIGTTRTRLRLFLKRFERLGLIKLTPEHRLMISQAWLSAYLQHLASGTGLSPGISRAFSRPDSRNDTKSELPIRLSGV